MHEGESSFHRALVFAAIGLVIIMAGMLWLAMKPQASLSEPLETVKNEATKSVKEAVRESTTLPATAANDVKQEKSAACGPVRNGENPEHCGKSSGDKVDKVPAANTGESVSASAEDGDKRSGQGNRREVSGSGGLPGGVESSSRTPAVNQSASAAGNAARVVEKAKSLIASAESAASRGDHPRACRDALAAWQAVHQYEGHDPQCQAMAAALLQSVKQYGETANETYHHLDTHTPLEAR